MIVEIFGTPICVDTARAQRFFTEHKMEWRLLNIRKGFSPADIEAIADIVGLEKLIARDKPRYAERGLEPIAPTGPMIESYLLEDPLLCRTPVIRFGPDKATVGWEPEIWERWCSEFHGPSSGSTDEGKKHKERKNKHVEEVKAAEPKPADANPEPKAEPNETKANDTSDPIF
jgi:arsenate reductase-like glutaredoxin family protein